MASKRSLVMKCDDCLQEYDTLERIPKFLKCFHTFCLLCLQQTTKSSRHDVFKETRRYRNLLIKGTAINCPTCSQETIVHDQSIEKGLQTNFYVMNQLGTTSLPATAGTSDIDLQKKSYYWCSICNATVTEDEGCLNHHDTYDLETEAGREMAENHLKTIFVTCKAQWNGYLAKHRETQSALKAAQIALQAVEMQIDIRSKENEHQITELQKQLSDVANRLSKPLEEKYRGENIHKLFQKYSQLMMESKPKKTSEFDSIRNAVVSMDIVQNSDGGKLIIPLFNSALINFPSEGTNEHESHLLTSLSILILLSIQKEQWVTSFLPRGKPLESTKNFKVKSSGTENKTEALGREVESKKMSKPLTRAASDAGKKRPEPSEYSKDKSIPNQNSSNWRTFSDGNGKQGNTRFTRKDQLTPKELLTTKWNVSSPAFQPSNPTFQETYHVSQTMMMPSVMSLRDKKVFFSIAVNGKQYGTIVIDLRPDLAPVMCQKFAQCCQVTEGPTYQRTIIYQSKPKTFIMGGKISGPESLYMADLSPLKKTRGAIFLRLKRDYVKTQCSIVSTEFCIHLGEESTENHRTATVFGYVCDGLAVCDAISYMDCSKEHVAIASVGIVG